MAIKIRRCGSVARRYYLISYRLLVPPLRKASEGYSRPFCESVALVGDKLDVEILSSLSKR